MKNTVCRILAIVCVLSLLSASVGSLAYAAENEIILTPETATGQLAYSDTDVILEAGTYSALALSVTNGSLSTNGKVVLDGNDSDLRALSFSGTVAINNADIEIINYSFKVIGGDWRTPTLTLNTGAIVTLTDSKIFIHSSGIADAAYRNMQFAVYLGGSSKLNLYASELEITDILTGSVVYADWNAEVCLYEGSLFNIHDITEATMQCFISSSNGSDGKVKLRASGESEFNFDRYTPSRILASGFHAYLTEGSTLNLTNSNTAANSLSVYATDSYVNCTGNTGNGITGDFFLYGNSLVECANNGKYGAYFRQCIIEDSSLFYSHDNASHGIVFYPSANRNNFYVRDNAAVLVVSNGATKSAGMSCEASFRGVEARRVTLNLEGDARWYTSRANAADLGATFSAEFTEPAEGAEPPYAVVREIEIETNDRCTVDTSPLLNLDNYPGVPNLLFAEQGVEYVLPVTPNAYNYISGVSLEAANADEPEELPVATTLSIGAENNSRQIFEIEAAPYQRTVNIAPGTGGSASEIGTGEYNADEDYVINFLPEDGNAVKNVIINGVDMGPLDSYTIPAFSTEEITIEIEYDRESIVSGSIVGCCFYHKVLYTLGCVVAAIKTVFGTSSVEEYRDYVDNGWGYVVKQYYMHDF